MYIYIYICIYNIHILLGKLIPNSKPTLTRKNADQFFLHLKTTLKLAYISIRK